MTRQFFRAFLALIFCFLPLSAQSSKSNQTYILLESGQFSADNIHLFPKSRNDASPAIFFENSERIWQNSEKTLILGENSTYLYSRFSRNGKFFAVVSQKSTDASLKSEKLLQIAIYNQAFQKLYELTERVPFDEQHPLIAVSGKDGAVIIGDASNGLVTFYDRRGNISAEPILFENLTHDYERAFQIAWDEAGESAAILCGKKGASPAGAGLENPSGEPHVFLFDAKGKALWQATLPGYSANALWIAASGEYIAANSFTYHQDKGSFDRSTVVFHQSGEIIARSDILADYAAVSANDSHILLADKSRSALFDLATGQQLWEKTFNERHGMISAIALANSGDRSVILSAHNSFSNGRFIFGDPTLHVVDASGDMVQSIEIRGEQFITPQLFIAPDAQTIWSGFSNNYKIYRVK